MPYKTESGSHYHMTYGCCRATISCGTKGLTPCSKCCGGNAEDDRGGAATPAQGGGHIDGPGAPAAPEAYGDMPRQGGDQGVHVEGDFASKLAHAQDISGTMPGAHRMPGGGELSPSAMADLAARMGQLMEGQAPAGGDSQDGQGTHVVAGHRVPAPLTEDDLRDLAEGDIELEDGEVVDDAEPVPVELVARYVEYAADHDMGLTEDEMRSVIAYERAIRSENAAWLDEDDEDGQADLDKGMLWQISTGEGYDIDDGHILLDGQRYRMSDELRGDIGKPDGLIPLSMVMEACTEGDPYDYQFIDEMIRDVLMEDGLISEDD